MAEEVYLFQELLLAILLKNKNENYKNFKRQKETLKTVQEIMKVQLK